MCPPREDFDYFPNKYMLLCPSRRQVLQLPQYRCTLTEFFDNGYRIKNGLDKEDWLWSAFAKPVKNVQPTQHFQLKFSTCGQATPLELLPSELITYLVEVFLTKDWCGDEKAENKHATVLALGISSPLLYPKVLSAVHLHLAREREHSWAGVKVGFHGCFSYSDDHQTEQYGTDDDPFSELQFWNRLHSQPELPWLNITGSKSDYLKELSIKDREKIREDLLQDWSYPKDRVWVLRNNSTRQLIRTDKLSARRYVSIWGQVAMPGRLRIKKLWQPLKRGRTNNTKDPITLAQVFLVMTAHSHENKVAPDELPFLFQDGPWNGHAFDLVTLEDHLASVESTEDGSEQDSGSWSDVSDVVAADVHHLRWCVEQFAYLETRTKSWRKDKCFWDSIIKDRLLHRAWSETRHLRLPNGYEGSDGKGQCLRDDWHGNCKHP